MNASSPDRSLPARAGKHMMAVTAPAVIVVATALMGTGVASAAVDSTNTVVSGAGDTIDVKLADTFIDSVAPLDGNPLTREWFHNGRAVVEVHGPTAAKFAGTLSTGYQFGYPASIGGSISVSYSTPDLKLSVSDKVSAEVSDILPKATAKVDIKPGSGVTEVEIASHSIAAPTGQMQLANVHGTATGILGHVTVRPYVKVISSDGDVAVTYGQPWTLN